MAVQTSLFRSLAQSSKGIDGVSIKDPKLVDFIASMLEVSGEFLNEHGNKSWSLLLGRWKTIDHCIDDPNIGRERRKSVSSIEYRVGCGCSVSCANEHNLLLYRLFV